MLVVRKIKYSQICSFWQSECEIRARYFFSISLISIPPFRLLSFRNYSKDRKKYNHFSFFFRDFDERISRHALENTKSWHWLRGCLYELSNILDMSKLIRFSWEVLHIIQGWENMREYERIFIAWKRLIFVSLHTENNLHFILVFHFRFIGSETFNNFRYFCSCPPILFNFFRLFVAFPQSNGCRIHYFYKRFESLPGD